MNRLLVLLFFTFFALSLEAYSKKIILASFSTETRAQEMMKKVPSMSPTLISLSKKHKVDLKVRQSGKYYILVAEVFHDKEVLNTFLQKIRKRFKGAYVSKYIIDKVEKLEIEKKIEITKKVEKVKVEKVKVEKKIEIQKKKIKQEIEKKPIIIPEKKINEKVVEQNPLEKNATLAMFEKYFEWTYLILFIIFSIFTYYFIKFKRIYDEY